MQNKLDAIEAKLIDIKALTKVYNYYMALWDNGANVGDKVKDLKEELTILKNQLSALESDYIYGD